MTGFVRLCLAAVAMLRTDTGRDVRLLFKEHPEDPDPGEIRELLDVCQLPWVRLTKAGTVRGFLEQAAVCITVNSTVGIEAIEQGTPLVAVGRALFAIPGVCGISGIDPAELAAVLRYGLSLNRELQLAFLDYLRFDYQVETSISSVATINFEPAVERILCLATRS
jgi:capsule polysaccharide modification protein KpsS